MSSAALFFALAAIEVAGLFAIWFRLKRKVRRYLELENLLEGAREEARALVLELNETTERNVSLVEDRIAALRETIADADRRIALDRREIESRSVEREVYDKLSRRRPIAPAPAAEAFGRAEPAPPPAPAREEAGPIRLSLGASPPRDEPAGPARAAPEVRVAEDIVEASRTRREEALELHRRGISAELIATRLGATVAEIELLVELEESRTRAGDGR